MKTSRRMLAIVPIATLLVAAIGLSVAAQGPEAEQNGHLPNAVPGWRGPGSRWRAFGDRTIKKHPGYLIGSSGEAIAEVLGMTLADLQDQMRDGMTLADLAENNGVDLAELRDLVQGEQRASLLDRIGEAVEAGRITETFSDWFTRGVDEGYVLDWQLDLKDGALVTAAAEALGMEPADVELQLWAGRTLSDLAEKNGVELTEVQDAIEQARLSEQQERIAEAVAEGRLSQEQADWMLEGLAAGDTVTQPGLRGLLPRLGDLRSAPRRLR